MKDSTNVSLRTLHGEQQELFQSPSIRSDTMETTIEQAAPGDLILIDGDDRDGYIVKSIDKHGNAAYRDADGKWRYARPGTYRISVRKEAPAQ
jgi:hypothetical protein